MSELNWVVWPDSKIEKTAMDVGNIVEQLETIAGKLNKIGYKYREHYVAKTVEDENVQGLLKALIERLYDELEDPA